MRRGRSSCCLAEGPPEGELSVMRRGPVMYSGALGLVAGRTVAMSRSSAIVSEAPTPVSTARTPSSPGETQCWVSCADAGL